MTDFTTNTTDGDMNVEYTQPETTTSTNNEPLVNEPSVQESIDNKVEDMEAKSKKAYAKEMKRRQDMFSDMQDRYIGVDDVHFSLPNKENIDSNMKEYFGVFLKERSFANLLNNRAPLSEEYSRFHEELLYQAPKKGKLGTFFDKFKSVKMPQEDAAYFDNLKALQSYINGGPGYNIEEKIDAIIKHRDIYLQKYSGAQRPEDLNNIVKNTVIATRYNKAIKKLMDFTDKNSSTSFMCPAIESFIDTAQECYSDFKTDIPEDYKRSMFNFLHNEYTKILQNENVSDRAVVVKEFNNLHKKIFGTDKEMVTLDVSPNSYTYNISNTPYILE